MSRSSAPLALITGASSGIGAAFARRLAVQQYDLMLVARRTERLEAMAAELRRQYGIGAEVLTADLSQSGDIALVEQRIRQAPALDLLINNAGFGTSGKFGESDLRRQLDMITVHVIATVRLTHAALSGMLAARRGGIVNISSAAAFIPTAGNVTYSATKAYLKVFSEALLLELTGTGIAVQVLVPGFTCTEFHEGAEYQGMDIKSRIPAVLWMNADQVVTESLDALGRGRLFCVPGLGNRLAVCLAGLGLGPVLAKALATRLPQLLNAK